MTEKQELTMVEQLSAAVSEDFTRQLDEQAIRITEYCLELTEETDDINVLREKLNNFIELIKNHEDCE